jgi:hypothetical protein
VEHITTHSIAETSDATALMCKTKFETAHNNGVSQFNGHKGRGETQEKKRRIKRQGAKEWRIRGTAGSKKGCLT